MAVRGMIPGDQVRVRMHVVFGLIVLCYLLLMARLLYVQGVQGNEIWHEATAARTKKIVIPAHRGSLCDRSGSPLAVSRYAGIVGYDPVALVEETRDPQRKERVLRDFAKGIPTLAGILNVPETTLRGIVTAADAKAAAGEKDRFYEIRRDVPLEMAQALGAMPNKPVGFAVQDSYRRIYTSRENAAHIVGLMTTDGHSVTGMERACDHWLNGIPGYTLTEVDRARHEIPDTRQAALPAKDGLDVVTTLDANVQHIVTEEAKRVQDKYHPKGVSVVAVDPNTGDILAMVSTPTFDPSPEAHQSWTKDSLTERCATRLYEPGSTLKALTVAAALDDGTITTQSGFQCGGAYQVGNKLIHCDRHGGTNVHGWVLPKDILRESCNVGALQIGLKMGAHHLFDADRRFGLLEKYDLSLPGVQRGRLSFDRNEKVYTASKAARVAFGHSITTTPLAVTMAYAAIANGGNLMQPRLVSATKDSDGKIKQTFAPKVLRQVLKPNVAAEVTEMLRGVIANGTGKVVAMPGYTVAGKTGTANKYRRGAYVGSFCGYLPASAKAKPRVVILVAVDEPQGAFYGADVAAPAFAAIAARLMTYWHVPEDDPQSAQYAEAQARLHHKLGIRD